MRVLHLDGGREMRGGQWQVLLLMRELRRLAEVDQTLLAPVGSPLAERARNAGFRVEPLEWLTLWRKARQVDLAHCHDARSHTLAALFCRAPLVVSRRVAFAPGRNPLARWKYRRPVLFLAVSHFVKRRLLAAGIPEARIRVVYDGVDLEGTPLPAQHRDSILAPLTADPRKGTKMLEEAARLAGVRVHYSSDLSSDLGAAQMFVYITHEEGLGSAALLAMAARVPVLASRVGGLPEIVRHEQTGLLTENHPVSIAAGIRRLLAAEDLRRRLAEAGRKMVESGFTSRHTARATLSAYREALV